MRVIEGQIAQLLAEAEGLERKAEGQGNKDRWPATSWLRQAQELRTLANMLKSRNTQSETKG